MQPDVLTLAFIAGLLWVIAVLCRDYKEIIEMYQNWRNPQKTTLPAHVVNTTRDLNEDWANRELAFLISEDIIPERRPDAEVIANAMTKPDTTEVYDIIAGTAWATPPRTADEVLAYIRKSYAEYDLSTAEYLVPLVWVVEDSTPHCYWARYTDAHSAITISKINHISVTGASDTGKDALLRLICLILALQHGPESLEFWVIDGKGDLILLSLLQATKVYAVNEEQIPDTFEQINTERKRRQAVVNRHSLETRQTHTWETLPDHVKAANNMTALAVVVISEILLLRAAFTTVKEFENQLTALMVAGRSAGMRIILSGQRFNNMGTAWRAQVSLFISSSQAFPDDDEPNVGLTTKMIRDLGAVPPSQLDPIEHRGVFTVVQPNGRKAITGRATFLNTEETQKIIERLPLKDIAEAEAKSAPAETPNQRTQQALAYIRQYPGQKQSYYEKAIFNNTGGPYWAAVKEALEILSREETAPDES